MKNLLPILLSCCLLAVFVSVTNAQKTEADVYTFGTQKIRIPAPEGFTDTFERFERVAGRFTSSEAPGNITLAAHVPNEFIPRLEAGEEPSFTYFTKVSVSMRTVDVDITPAMFQALSAEFKKQFPTLIDPNGPVMNRAVDNAAKGLSKHWGTDTQFDIKETRNLGHFNNTSNVFSGLMLMRVEMLGKADPLLVSTSFVNVKNRLIFVYAYRLFSSEQDADVLRDFTKKWTAAIVAANVPPPPPAPKKR